MNNLNILENKKILKDYESASADYTYKNELISNINDLFLTELNTFLDTHKELKGIYEDIVRREEQELINADIEEAIENEEDYAEEDYAEQKSKKIKKLYRSIANMTHPDIIKHKMLNNLYMKASDYYEDNDLSGIYSICTELEIDFEIESEEKKVIEEKTSQLKTSSVFLENTLLWKWYNASTADDKNKMILEFIKNKIS